MLFARKAISGSTLIALVLASSTLFAGPPEIPTLEVNVTNTPGVVLENGIENPVPVQFPDLVPVKIAAPAESTVVCYFHGGAGVAEGPFINGGFNVPPLTAIKCPEGITKVDVQRLVVSPDFKSANVNVAQFRTTVTFGAPYLDPEGFLAILTEGKPESPVAQQFILDITDASRYLVMSTRATSGIVNFEPHYVPTLLLIGVPLP